MTVGFEQATIKVEREQEFGRLQEVVRQVFLPDKVERFLKQLSRKGLRVRDFDGLLAAQTLEMAGGMKSGSGSARALYDSLTVSDQAQMREFYLSKLETVDQALRHKFKKLYQYY